MKLRVIAAAAAAMCSAVIATAQVSRPLPIVEANPDVRTSALGNVSMGEARSMYLYTNPGAFLYGEKMLTADLSMEMYPTMKEVKGRLAQYNVSAGYRFLDRHAVFAGFRYQGGLSIPNMSSSLTPGKKTTDPVDWTVDLGYAFKINQHFSAYATGSFYNSYTGLSAQGVLFGFGANYRTDLSVGNLPTLLNVGVKAADFGPAINYGKSSYSAPGSIQAGATWDLALLPNHGLTVAAGTRYYMLPAEAQLINVGAGLEYNFSRMIFVRGGYEYGSREVSHATCGIGAEAMGIKLDLAYRLAVGEYGSSTWMLGVGYAF